MRLKLLTFLIALLVPLSSAWGAGFKDTAGQWWEQSIAECNAASIMVGRSDDLFVPKESVTRMEAIILLNRALGFRNEADGYAMSPGGYNFPADFPEWGKRNVAFAADKGYISKSGIPTMQPKHPASRAEIAVLFANALNLSADGYQLNFADNAAIASSLQPFVAAAVKHGVMVGKTDNKFEPNANVTRGEMAVIIARLFENGKINPQASNYYVAKVSSVDSTNKKITVTKGGQTLTLSLASDAELFRGGSKGTIGAFKANDNVKVVLDSTGKVTYLADTSASTSTVDPPVTSIPTQNTLTGTIQGLQVNNPLTITFQPDNGSITSYPLLSTVIISQNGYLKDLTSLTSGTRAEVKFSGGSISEIKLLLSGKESKGYIINSFLDYFTVRYDDGTSEQIDRTSVSSGYTNFARGQRVALEKVGGLVTNIVPLSETPKVFGHVVSVGSSGITIEDADGYDRTYPFTSNYKIKDKDGYTISRSDIEQGDTVEIEITDQQQASNIKLLDNSSSVSDLEGEVTYIKTSGTYRITIKKSDGSEKTYDVNDNVEVYRYNNSSKRSFDYINEHDYVKLTTNSRDYVTKIDVLDTEVVEGEITHIDTYDQTIEIKNSSDRKRTYDVVSNVTVWEDGRSRTFRSLRSGDNVRVILNKNYEVITINLGTSSSVSNGSYSGIIAELDINEDKIKIERNGNTTLYTLDDDVTVVNDNGNYLDKIIIGSEAEVRVESSKVTRIKVTNYERIKLTGNLEKISAGRAYIYQDNGTRNGVTHMFLIAERATLKDRNDRSIEFSDLGSYKGKDIEFELRYDEVEYLKIK
ncbi:S-layer homology domain-containing protein [Desulforamulus aquiferis]|uniref:S-layer homology domain-containing protein n=1 Tax=Desulforamulus aquiferis TaxID=1397668 RepID=UPI003570E89E